MKLKYTITTAMIGCLCVTPTNANAWWAIMHYSIARFEMGDQIKIPQYANVPDAWPSSSATFITKGFLFSHGAVDAGRGVAPDKPIYPHDGRYPELLMAEFYKKVSRTKTEQDIEIILGCAAHNAADNNVHWEFFKAGDYYDWHDDHLRKEEWADYYGYMHYYFPGVTLVPDTETYSEHPEEMVYGFMFSTKAEQDKVFGATGAAKSEIPDSEIRIPTNGAWVLSLAQKALRKSGYHFDEKDSGSKFTYSQSETEIANQITTFNETKFGDGLSGVTDFNNNGTVTDWWKWDVTDGSWGGIKLARFEQLRKMAVERKWKLNELEFERRLSTLRAKEWVAFIQGQLEEGK